MVTRNSLFGDGLATHFLRPTALLVSSVAAVVRRESVLVKAPGQGLTRSSEIRWILFGFEI